MKTLESQELHLIHDRLSPLRASLLDHPVYSQITSIEGIRIFMEDHVFAVWDFMSLLKALQRKLCCVDQAWVPPKNSKACRLINEIVLAEESDEDGEGGFASHFELYLRAMESCGASTEKVRRFLEAISHGQPVTQALENACVSDSVRTFVSRTFHIIEHAELGDIAAEFAFGRENLLPDLFRKIVDEIDQQHPSGLERFRYYLDRHIELDGDEHGGLAEDLVMQCCGANDALWRSAEHTAVESLIARGQLWDGISQKLTER